MEQLKGNFSKGITKGAFRTYIGETFDVDNFDLFTAAVSQGYDDAKRTFAGISKFWEYQNNEENVSQHRATAFFEFIAKNIQAACKNPPMDFYEWHTKTCQNICQWLNDKGYKNCQHGQTQKIMNMTFKYLYCLPGAEDHEIFKACHMPLDSFTLEWYKRFIWKKGLPKITENDKWSNLNEEKYNSIAREIEKHLEISPLFCYKGKNIQLPRFPLDAEFYIWEEMQMHMAVESFIFSFYAVETKEKKLWKEKSVLEKMDKAIDLIKNYKDL